MLKKILTATLFAASLAITPTWANESSEKVNINTADAEMLDNNLKYVGEKTAKRIVDYRKEHGNFKSVDDITQVRGVGEQIIKANRTIMTTK
ncbi:helix-hairpin-helix domain-containing protein [Sansalvadorimonas sp. 2012CJ34-2]|uniref:Helix-hairpin-helix domain-containing protein n=1 Tax=Parendozoicomonas callyspongiae TaxID=2942213 RepID=A0ABT0PKT9_9GAMM|nr:helix-hairpin-helix domain-containing protein [Sansalvadorimonas sp. 2012CJ34-2]MCL6271342.1 helix-hairpin-helix domain-containing protein [Sansalvadorimonas sp. 2012CJ34-2]